MKTLLFSVFVQDPEGDLIAALMGTGVVVGVLIFWFVLAVLWLILPFALFGIKPLLREVRDEMKAVRIAVDDRNRLEEHRIRRRDG